GGEGTDRVVPWRYIDLKTEPNSGLKTMKIGSLSPSPHWGEGTDRVVRWRYIDLKNRAELRFENNEDRLPFPLSPLGRGLG
ncbi:hypothetical protein, partial [Pseudomonas frederiksbergensis]|uniref:hypothetical protein n=1 Tax=Pseudomonas frederiksbergensis TaxID=104087 RepID=UPI001C833C0E